MDRYTIADLEKLTGIRTGTIRIWERRYRIIKPHRTDTNRRWYDDDDFKRIINISILYRHGFKISKIASMSGVEIAREVALLTRETSDTDTQLDSLVVAMTDFNEKAINDILMRAIINIGFEETFERIVFPFQRRVGVMWQTGSVDIGAEHFMSNIFRKRLIVATDSLPPPDAPDRKRVQLYLPESEWHELGLLFYAFVARKAGHDTLYLGQSTPFNAMADVAERWNADIIITGSLTGLPYDRPEDYLKRLSSVFSNRKILVAGAMATAAGKKTFDNVFAVNSAAELKKHL
ncbi:MAG: MerR family transcriptional regulator [Bacteroidales bacterium]|nr:MerR family transcriptional regulator [Bacteroidales bacterium]MDT8373439.1 MerR family transcriptional regulator [Bacteroidales bacterium]